MKHKNQILLLLTIVLLAASCQKDTTCQVSLIPVKTNETTAGKAIDAYLEPYRTDMNRVMDIPIGKAAMTMDTGRPESTLSNFICDQILNYARKIQHVDFAITNIGGLRNPIPQGEITLKTIFEVFPFDNRLVILTLRGNDVKQLCNAMAAVGGEGVSGISFKIQQKQATNIRIKSIPIDTTKNYVIATSDYLSFGNDKLTPLSRYIKQYDTSVQIRDIIIESIRNFTKQNKSIKSTLDRRIL